MYPENLRTRFKHSLRQLRQQLQYRLTRLFEANAVVTADFLRALGLAERDSNGLIRPREPIWKQGEDGKWRFLPKVMGENAIEYAVEEPRPVDADAAVVASCFGLWVYLFDPSRGTYYYPFPDSNLLYGNPNRPYFTEPGGSYRQRVASFLRDYRLMIGEGSQGIAARGARCCVLESTFTDVRGGVALEDLLLRNLCYMSLPVFASRPVEDGLAVRSATRSFASRFRNAPFAYVALTFPAPLQHAADSLRFVFQQLVASGGLHEPLEVGSVSDDSESDRGGADRGPTSWADSVTAMYGSYSFAQDAATALESLACHLQDHLLLRKHRTMTASLGSQDSSSFIEAAVEFARLIGRPVEGYDAIGLRDPFAFGGLHLITTNSRDDEKAGIRKRSSEVLRFYPNAGTLSSLLMRRFEAHVESELNEDEQGDWFRRHVNELENVLAGEGQAELSLLDHQVWGEVDLATPEGTWGRNPGRIRLELQVAELRGTNRTVEVDDGVEAWMRCEQAWRTAIEGMLGGLREHGSEWMTILQSWIGATQGPEVTEWRTFDQEVSKRKVLELSLGIICRAIAWASPVQALAREAKSLGAENDVTTAGDDAVPKMDALEEELRFVSALVCDREIAFLESVRRNAWVLANSIRPLAENGHLSKIVFMAMTGAENCAMVGSACTELQLGPADSEDERVELETKRRRRLHSNSVRRVLGTVARSGELMPGSGHSDDGQWEVRSVRVSTLQSNSEEVSRDQLDSFRGMGRDGKSFNHSLLTALSDPADIMGCSSGTTHSWLHYFGPKGGAERLRSLVVLGPELEAAALQSVLQILKSRGAGVGAADVLAALSPEIEKPTGASLVVTQWDVTADTWARRLFQWSTNRAVLIGRRHGPESTAEAADGERQASESVSNTLLSDHEHWWVAEDRVRLLRRLAYASGVANRGRDKDSGGCAEGNYVYPEILNLEGGRPVVRPTQAARVSGDAMPSDSEAEGVGRWWGDGSVMKNSAAELVELLTAKLPTRGMHGTRPADEGSAGPRGTSLFAAPWGLQQHLVWPVNSRLASGPEDVAVFILSTYVSSMADARRDKYSPLFLAPGHDALLAACMDYLEFIMRQDDWRLSLTNQRYELVHDFKNDLMSMLGNTEQSAELAKELGEAGGATRATVHRVAKELRESSEEVFRIQRDFYDRLKAELAWLRDAKEVPGRCLNSAGDLSRYLEDTLGEALYMSKANFSAKYGVRSFRPRPVRYEDSEEIGEFPVWLPPWTISTAIQEFVMNAAKYSQHGPGGRPLVLMSCRWVKGLRPSLRMEFESRSGGATVGAGRVGRGGLQIIERRLQLNFGPSARVIRPSVAAVLRVGEEIVFGCEFSPGIYRDSIETGTRAERGRVGGNVRTRKRS